MTQEALVSVPQAGSPDPAWKPLYRLAGAGLLVTVGFVVVDIALSFSGGDVPVGQTTALDWFGYLQEQPFVALRNLGLFNIINPLLTLPFYLGLFQMHRHRQPVLATLAFLSWLLGLGVYIANNPALPLLALSQQYAQAAGETSKSLLAAAGTTLLARGEDFTPGSFAGLFLQSAASVGMLWMMVQGRLFSRRWSLFGLSATVFLLVFTVCATFAPALFDLAMILALLGGLMMLAWNIRMAFQMLRLGSKPAPETTAAPGRTALGQAPGHSAQGQAR